MFTPFRKSSTLAATLVLLLPLAAFPQNRVMGQLRFDARGWTNNSAGVWVDGQYVGYIKELHGKRKILLLPGKHTIQVREAGYQDFSDNLVAAPGKVYAIPVSLQKDPSAHYSSSPAVVKIHIRPDRAAVFVDGMYAGHADQFDGRGKELLLTPGNHKIDITMPGFRSFTTQVSLLPKQVFKLETRLAPGSVLRADANLRPPAARSVSE